MLDMEVPDALKRGCMKGHLHWITTVLTISLCSYIFVSFNNEISEDIKELKADVKQVEERMYNNTILLNQLKTQIINKSAQDVKLLTKDAHGLD